MPPVPGYPWVIAGNQTMAFHREEITGWYVVKVAERLDSSSSMLPCGAIVWPSQQGTYLYHQCPDQAALHGLIKWVRDYGLTLVSLNPTGNPENLSC